MLIHIDSVGPNFRNVPYIFMMDINDKTRNTIFLHTGPRLTQSLVLNNENVGS